MADTPLDDRRFTEKEVGEILKKAVERAPSAALARSEGTSLAELKTIGAEVGIDPGRLEDAARSVALSTRNSPSRILGGPTVINFERKVEGTIPPEATTEVLALIRRTMGKQGSVSEVHGSLEWSDSGESGERHVTISPRDGSTTIRGSSNLTQAAVVTYLPAGIFGTLISGIGLLRFIKADSPLALVLALVVLPILYPILRTIFSKVSSAESAKLEQVVDDLARMAEDSAADE